MSETLSPYLRDALLEARTSLLEKAAACESRADLLKIGLVVTDLRELAARYRRAAKLFEVKRKKPL